MTHEDGLVYQIFLVAPAPCGKWVAEQGRKFPRSESRWRPFAGPLSIASQRQAGIILNSMFHGLLAQAILWESTIAFPSAEAAPSTSD
jgi:integrase/recombinase XerD